MKNIMNLNKFMAILLCLNCTISHAATPSIFNIRTLNWIGTLPGAATYDKTQLGVQVTASADRILNVSVDPLAVYAGNDSPAVDRNFTYNFPSGSDVSIEFFHLELNASNLAESVGNFNPAPSSMSLAAGHNYISANNTLIGSATSNTTDISTLSWSNISSLSFNVASNGNVSLVAHKNLQVTASVEPNVIPSSSKLEIFLLILSIIFLVLWKQNDNKENAL